MAKRTYGQYCGVARALELVGERWALLIVRDLLVEPKRFSALQAGLPRIPSNILTARLKELEEAGIVRRRLLPRPGGVVYELTEAGAALEEVVLALGRWGAPRRGEPGPDEVRTVDSMVMALRATFHPEAARGLHLGFALHLGDLRLHAVVDDGHLRAGPGPLPDPDLTIETGPSLRPLLAGQVTPAAALASGAVRLDGPPELLDRFVLLFRIGGATPATGTPPETA